MQNLENAPAVIFRFDFWKISIFSAFVPSILKRQKTPIKTPAIIPAEAAVPVTSEISDSDEPPVFVNAETIAETISVTTDMIKVYQTRFLVANAVSFRNLCQSHPIFRSPFPINRPAKSHCSQLFVLSSFPVSYLFNKTAFYNYNTGKSKRLPDNDVEFVSVNSVLEESILGFYAVLQERNITPNISMPENKVFRKVNRAALSRIFSNLLNNAIKYSDGDLNITLNDTGEITFSNTASDLSEVDVKKLFDRFYTVENARKSTGLGLSISRILIEQMKGTISAHYKNGKLSICIWLPDVSGD